MASETATYRPGLDEVYRVNQVTGEVTYKGQYRGNGGKYIRNSIHTVAARQARRRPSVL